MTRMPDRRRAARPIRSQVIGFMPARTESFELRQLRVMPLWAQMPHFFEGSGIQVDFEAQEITGGYFSLWLTLADAKALQAELASLIDRVTTAALRGAAEESAP